MIGSSWSKIEGTDGQHAKPGKTFFYDYVKQPYRDDLAIGQWVKGRLVQLYCMYLSMSVFACVGCIVSTSLGLVRYCKYVTWAGKVLLVCQLGA